MDTDNDMGTGVGRGEGRTERRWGKGEKIGTTVTA